MRFRLRTAMILVALAALTGAGYRAVVVMPQRVKDYSQWARLHDLARKVVDLEADDRWAPWEQREAAKKSRGWYAARSAAYRRAASRPWIVVPDEPGPAVAGESERHAAEREHIHRKLDAYQAELTRTATLRSY